MLSETTKKIFIISGFAIVVVVLAFAIYFVFFRGAPSSPIVSGPATNEPINLPSGQLPDSIIGNVNQEFIGSSEELGGEINLLPEGLTSFTQEKSLAIEQATNGQALAPKSSAGGINYYAPADNKFYRLNNQGESQELSAVSFYNVENVTWSNDGAKAVLEYPDGANIVYDFNSGKQYTLPKEFEEFSFSSNGSEIAAKVIGERPEHNWLVTSNIDGSGIKFVEPMGENSDKVAVNISPNGQVVALYAKNTGANDQEVLLIGRNQENFYSLKTLGRGFVGEWTPTGDKLLYSVYSSDNGFRPSLWIADAQGDNVGLNNKRLNLNTWPDKCVFADNETAYCAVPQSLPEGSGIYPAMSSGVYDDFYKIDLRTGISSELNIGNELISAKSLTLSADGRNLYAEDAIFGGLLKISL